MKSNIRIEFQKSGEAIRENKDTKIRYHLIPEEMITRLAIHYTNGADVHGEGNWQNGDFEFMLGCKESAYRHFMAWLRGDEDEDHAMALVWNIFTYEMLHDFMLQDALDELKMLEELDIF